MNKVSRSILIFDERDNVATAVQEICAGTAVTGDLYALEKIPFVFKIALRNIPAGQDVIKYGIPIGKATMDISAGACVHIHNAASKCDHRSSGFNVENAAPTDMQYCLTEATI